jgi:hypothetical protein
LCLFHMERYSIEFTELAPECFEGEENASPSSTRYWPRPQHTGARALAVVDLPDLTMRVTSETLYRLSHWIDVWHGTYIAKYAPLQTSQGPGTRGDQLLGELEAMLPEAGGRPDPKPEPNVALLPTVALTVTAT